MERIVHLKLNQSKPPNQNLKNENTLGKEPNDHPIANHSTNYNLLTKISPIPNSDTNKFQLIGNFTRHSTNELVQGNLRVQPSIDPTFHQNTITLKDYHQHHYIPQNILKLLLNMSKFNNHPYTQLR